MSSERVLVVRYCDDIRQETGNKFSLMGCYADELILTGPLPAFLPKLCAFVTLLVGHQAPIEQAKLIAYMNDEAIGDLELALPPPSEIQKGIELRPWSKRIGVSAFMVFSPFLISAPGELRIDAETNDGTVRGMALRIANVAVVRVGNDAVEGSGTSVQH